MGKLVLSTISIVFLVFLSDKLYSQGTSTSKGVYGVGQKKEYQGLPIGGRFYEQGKRNKNISALASKSKSAQKNSTYTYTVGTTRELVQALMNSKSGETIYLEDGKSFDLSNYGYLPLKDNVRITSGEEGEGATVYVKRREKKLENSPVFHIKGNNVLVAGIKFKGPDTGVYFTNNNVAPEVLRKLKERSKKGKVSLETLKKMYGQPTSFCFLAYSKQSPINFIIQDCEIFGWTYAGIVIMDNAKGTIQRNYIHHNKHFGLGYGIYVNRGEAIVRGNYFNHNRHSIAGSGEPGSIYEASYNIVGPDGIVGHAFDMHGGKDRNDGTNTAGTRISIHNNEFLCDAQAVVIRGVPLQKSEIFNNLYTEKRHSTSKAVFSQRNSKGNISIFDNKIVRGGKQIIKKGSRSQ